MDRAVRRVGIIGLGKMGRPIARHLVRGGFEVHGLDVNPASNNAARANKVTIATSPADLASRCDLIIILTAYEEQVEEAIFGSSGVVEGAKPGAIVAVAATINPAGMRDIATRLEQRGLISLDIPLCRGEGPAEAGKLLMELSHFRMKNAISQRRTIFRLRQPSRAIRPPPMPGRPGASVLM